MSLLYIYIYICIYKKQNLISVKQCSIHRSRVKYILWRKKTNKLQVHPYKPVSWSPTHQGIFPLMSGRPQNRLVGMNLSSICFFPPQYICVCVCVCVCVYIYIYTYIHTYIHIYIHIYIPLLCPSFNVAFTDYFLHSNP